ncbi:MAG TPA: rhodanese-like domain-containing protein [Gammaproteobacteria bacterium]|nr:rhodanese-like domain-containing protein [Gammaproteobacteria bacterium]
MGQLAEHVINHPYLVAGLVALLAAVAVYELRGRVQGGYGIAPADAVRLMNKGAIVYDLRKPEEYRAGHIVGARNVEPDALGSERSPIKKQKNKVLILVCDTGAISGRAAASLRKAGYENAFSLKGGLNAWRADNLPLVKES